MNKKSSTKDLGLTSNERLFLKNKSIFSPKKFIDLKPNSFKIYTFHAGFKIKLEDLLIIIFDIKLIFSCLITYSGSADGRTPP